MFSQVLAHSSPTHIILNNAASDTSGVFRCEVSAGPPRFSTASRTTHLQIVGETNSKTFYRLTDKVRFKPLERAPYEQKILKILKFGLFMREIRLHQKLQEDENMLIYHKHKCNVSLFS